MGWIVGGAVGSILGTMVGSVEGLIEGDTEGKKEGIRVGRRDGVSDGALVGAAVGLVRMNGPGNSQTAPDVTADPPPSGATVAWYAPSRRSGKPSPFRSSPPSSDHPR